MRFAVVNAVVIAGLAAPALACPPREACLVSLRSTTSLRVAEVTPRPTQPTAALATVSHALRLPSAAKRATSLAVDGVEMPWIWRVLREQVYSRMPSYERRDELKLVLAPVVVTSPSDTVPGVGIAGDF